MPPLIRGHFYVLVVSLCHPVSGNMLDKKGSKKQLIEERRKLFKEWYVKVTLIEAKRLEFTVEELQEIVKEAYKEID